MCVGPANDVVLLGLRILDIFARALLRPIRVHFAPVLDETLNFLRRPVQLRVHVDKLRVVFHVRHALQEFPKLVRPLRICQIINSFGAFRVTLDGGQNFWYGMVFSASKESLEKAPPTHALFEISI